MGRRPRIDHPDARYHLMNRGAHHEPIFHRTEDRELFLARLAELEPRYGLEIRAFALMPNHFHLLAISRDGRLSEAMHYLQGPFAQRVRRREGGDGRVFRGRFRHRRVLEDAYWTHLYAYLHLNPERAGLDRTEDPLWTSLSAICAGREWLHAEQTLADFGGLRALRAHMADVAAGSRPRCFDPDALWTPAVPRQRLPAARARAA